jgi:ribosomal protein S18 acetylase RimI-like enzyme
MPTIRTADIADAAALAELAEASFRSTFAATNTDEDMALYCRQHFGEAIQKAEIESPELETVLVEEQQRLIAFAQLRRGDAPRCVVAARPGEIQRFYVRKDWQGRGIAQCLMRHCLDTLECRGADLVWLGVWERNTRAIAFYRKFGFVEAGEHVFVLGNDRQRDILMCRRMAF